MCCGDNGRIPHPKLDNLVRINQPKVERPNATEVKRMLDLAEYEGFLDIEVSTLMEFRTTCQDLLADAQSLVAAAKSPP